ncbi:MAG: hypothetical protein JWO95_3097 [Verrucomicrobiales bacterium]|nr:hypothetical protein [Verrucomicrobiales bacterium]
MDDITAKRMTERLRGHTLGGWPVLEFINHGKSAVVFRSEKNGVKAALKVFDPEIVQKYGADNQRKRIERERSLIDKQHPNLVRIFDGGEADGLMFIAMEFFEGKNLAEVLPLVPMAEVRRLIAQIAAAAKFLEDISFAHRDIKPENIGISADFKLAKLLDLGVLRPLNLSNVTDQGDQQYFIGTLQYGPPELIFREEQQSLEAWRAITFYQLGAVLHDLLMRRPLFEEFKNPYPRMVVAVEREIPHVENSSADADLRLLAQNCLAKSPTHRLDTVTWDDFNKPKIADPLEAARKKIAQHKVIGSQESERIVRADDLIAAQSFALRSAIQSAVATTTKLENLPRYSTLPILKPNPFLLRILFEPSIADDLKCNLAVYCRADVLDALAALHELRVFACICMTREAVPAEPEPLAFNKSVKGALIEQDIRSHIQVCIVEAFSQALGVTLDKPNSIQWLTFGGKP